MTESLKVLVVGATGTQGGAVAQRLKRNGHQVRALTRDPQSQAAIALKSAGSEVVAGDLGDRDATAKAAEGVNAIFAMATPFEAGVDAEVRHGENVLAAAKSAGVQHLLYSSVASADQSTGIPHFDSKAEIERKIESSGVPYTIVAPVYFMENALAPWTVPELKQGRLPMALPAERVLQQVAVEDIADFAVLALEQRERFLNRRIDIAGDELTGPEAAQALSEASGRAIEYVELPVEQRAAMGEDFKRMLDWFDETGYSTKIDQLRREYPEVSWHTYQEWARTQDWSVLN